MRNVFVRCDVARDVLVSESGVSEFPIRRWSSCFRSVDGDRSSRMDRPSKAATKATLHLGHWMSSLGDRLFV